MRAQVYETERIVVVGSGSTGRHAADGAGVEWMSTVPNLLGSIDATVTHLWFLYAGALPRPDALEALISEAERSDAAVAGSKLVRADDPERLIAVGIATDVFDVPYLGLEENEIDAGQYDVVRDVAAVAGVSMLIRRDLARGVGGPDPKMPPEASAIDLCQRARLRGARVVVVPSSEVMYPADKFRAESWREWAGRIRAMLKVYSLLTLLWAIPLRLLIGLVEVVVSPFLGRWALFDFIRAWIWNLIHLPSLIRERFAARKGKAFGDAELFRYQLRGSAVLSDLAGEIGGRLRSRLDREDGRSLASIGNDLRQPAFIVGVLTVVVSLLSVRSLWSSGWPAVGSSMPLPESAGQAIGAYAGGWNPGGFGSTEALPPLIGFAGAIQWLLFDSPQLAAWTLSLLAVVAGIWGTIRLVRIWDIEVVAGWIGGIVLVAGPAAQAIGDRTAIGHVLALGALPWAIRVAVTKWPSGWAYRIGRLLAAGWVTGIMAILAPPLLVVPAGVLLIRVLLKPNRAATWRALAISIAGTVLAMPLLLPWLAVVDLEEYLTAGAEYWTPELIPLVAIGVAFAAGLLAAKGRQADAVLVGGVLVAGGAVLARGFDLGLGREAAVSGLAIAALGSSFVVAGVVDSLRTADIRGSRRVLGGLGAVGGVVLLALTVIPLYEGRGLLPSDEYTEPLRFTEAADGEATSSRILLVGPEDTLPGEWRLVRGAAYRVVSAPLPALWEVALPGATAVDQALESVLLGLIDGEESRAGAALAEFGIRWVVVTGDTPLEAVFDGQLDLISLGGAKRPTFLVDSENPVRAVTAAGNEWGRAGTGYAGEPASGERVRVAETANSRWSPGPWSQDGWGNEVSAATGEVWYEPIESRRSQASAAAGVLALYVVGSALARRAGR
ncbi:MAG: hypothetical protein QNJ81_14055 [Acidimicrobiia bacterium]|nr:hypothetical protein [Acidimicrobiia bacterium]